MMFELVSNIIGTAVTNVLSRLCGIEKVGIIVLADGISVFWQ